MLKQAYEYVMSLSAITLVLFGIGGVSFHAFREDGWIETAVGNIWRIEFQYPLIAVPLTLAGITVFVAWRRHHLLLGHVSRVPAVFVYLLMAAGAYFMSQYALHGSL